MQYKKSHKFIFAAFLLYMWGVRIRKCKRSALKCESKELCKYAGFVEEVDKKWNFWKNISKIK